MARIVKLPAKILPPAGVGAQMLWSILDQLPVAVYLKDRESRFIYVNTQGARSLGLSSPQEIIGQTDFKFFRKELAAKWIEDEQRMVHSGDPMTNVEEKEQYLNGREAWVLTSKFPLRDAAGTIVGLFGISKDITDTEEELRRYRLAVEGAGDGLWYREVATEKVWYSRRWKEIIGYQDNEIDNKSVEFRNRVHPEDWERVQIACDDHFRGRSKFYECELRMMHRDGKYRWIRTRGKMVRDDQGKPKEFAGSHTDITKSKDAERFFIKVLDTLPAVLVFVKDNRGRFVFVNRSLASNFNMAKEDIIGKTDADINPNQEQVKQFQRVDRRVLDYGETIHIEREELTSKTGRRRFLTTDKIPFPFPDSYSPRHVLGIAADITDLEEAKADLEKTLTVLADGVREIENSATEEDACRVALLYLYRLSYPSVMLSFLRPTNGNQHIVGDLQYASGKWKAVAPRTDFEFSVPDEQLRLLGMVLRKREAQFISQANYTDQRDRDFYRRYGIESQYVVPLATDSLPIGTMQVDMESMEKKPKIACRMLDTLAAHLSLCIERLRTFGKIESQSDQLTRQATFITFNYAAAGIVHDLGSSITDYQIQLNNATRNIKIRSNKDAYDFLNMTKATIAQWWALLKEQLRDCEGDDYLESHDIPDVIKAVLDSLVERAKRRGCKIHPVYEAQGASVLARLGQLKLMLSALIRNAIDANARKVTVDVRKVCEKDPTVGEKRFVEFLVRDDGHGIPIEYRSQIGKPGWTSKGKRGHGIGLTIVDLLSRDMGGRLVLLSGGKSVGEKETVFSLRLPGHHH